MATRTIKKTGKDTDVNAEGNEKTGGASTTTADLKVYTLTDDNVKVRGLAAGQREASRTK